MSWDAKLYLQFEKERTQPARDLAWRVDLPAPQSIVDLGCGPGNSTRVLAERWPNAQLVGIDSSAAMIESARRSGVPAAWQIADFARWQPGESYDLVFSNAAVQWVPDHAGLFVRLFDAVRPGGALAVQLPRNPGAVVQEIMREIAAEPHWRAQLSTAAETLTSEPLPFYYDLLHQWAKRIDLWMTDYGHILPDCQAVIDWIRGTGLRPYLEALPDEAERNAFLSELSARVRTRYPPQRNGRIIFMFKRSFVIAYR